jgi:hypothetical protein
MQLERVDPARAERIRAREDPASSPLGRSVVTKGLGHPSLSPPPNGTGGKLRRNASWTASDNASDWDGQGVSCCLEGAGVRGMLTAVDIKSCSIIVDFNIFSN